MEVRQCILAFATHSKQGHNTFVLEDQEQESGCAIRYTQVDQVLAVNGDCPAFIIYYKEFKRTNARPVHEVMNDVFGKWNSFAVRVSTSRLERAMLLKIDSLDRIY